MSYISSFYVDDRAKLLDFIRCDHHLRCLVPALPRHLVTHFVNSGERQRVQVVLWPIL